MTRKPQPFIDYQMTFATIGLFAGYYGMYQFLTEEYKKGFLGLTIGAGASLIGITYGLIRNYSVDTKDVECTTKAASSNLEAKLDKNMN